MRLLNGMHEGVLILKKPKDLNAPPKWLFCNKPALKFIKKFFGSWDHCESQEELDTVQQQILTKKSFSLNKLDSTVESR